MKTILAAIAVCLLASSLAIAQDTRVAVSVNHRGNDQVGQQVAAALKQAIRGSKSFRFVYDEVAPSFPRIVAYLATINVDKDTGASAISTTLSYDSFDIRGRGIYLTSLVQYCTRLSVETCAKGILPYLDATVESFLPFDKFGLVNSPSSLGTKDRRMERYTTPHRGTAPDLLSHRRHSLPARVHLVPQIPNPLSSALSLLRPRSV